MSKIIDVQPVIDKIKAALDMNIESSGRAELEEVLKELEAHYPPWYAEQIKELPPAQPEIIRCKDCKHRDKYGCCKHWKGLAMGDIPIATDDNDFCSNAER